MMSRLNKHNNNDSQDLTNTMTLSRTNNYNNNEAKFNNCNNNDDKV